MPAFLIKVYGIVIFIDMQNLTYPASILLVNSGGIVGDLITSVSAQDLPPYIKLVDTATFFQVLDLTPANLNGDTGIIIIDIPDASESKACKM